MALAAAAAAAAAGGVGNWLISIAGRTQLCNFGWDWIEVDCSGRVEWVEWVVAATRKKNYSWLGSLRVASPKGREAGREVERAVGGEGGGERQGAIEIVFILIEIDTAALIGSLLSWLRPPLAPDVGPALSHPWRLYDAFMTPMTLLWRFYDAFMTRPWNVINATRNKAPR